MNMLTTDKTSLRYVLFIPEFKRKLNVLLIV